ncbi:MAG: DUF1570 domain-containing protein [Myxococcota bacterium]
MEQRVDAHRRAGWQARRLRTKRRAAGAIGVLWALVMASLHAFAVPPLPWRPEAPEAFRAPLAVDEAGEAERLAVAGPDFRIERTDHFSLVVHVESRTASYRGKILEDLHAAWTRFFTDLGFTLEAAERKHAMIFAPTRERLVAILGVESLPSAISGIYVPDRRLAYFFDTLGREADRARDRAVGELVGDLRAIRRRVARAEDDAEFVLRFRNAPNRTYTRDDALALLDGQLRRTRRERAAQVYDLAEDGLGTMTHEAAHQLTFELGLFGPGSRPPLWLVEGLATLFEPTRHGFLLETSKPNWGRWSNLDQRRRAGEPARLKALVASDAPLLGFEADIGASAYDDAWAIVHFLVTTEPEAFARYVRRVAATPEDASEAARLAVFEETFGAGVEAVESRMRAYLLTLGDGSEGGIDAFRETTTP